MSETHRKMLNKGFLPMSLTPGAATFTADSYQKDSVGYVGVLKTNSVKDDIALRRVHPKPTATFSGVARSGLKFTRTMTLTGALTPTADLIYDVSVSCPVGVDPTALATATALFAAMAAEADFATLVSGGKITY